MIRFVPWFIPANIITIISNLFVYLGLILSIHADISNKFTPVAIGACLIMYLIGDHLDGMQAKRTGTGSALGEFCDHYLDAFNNGIIVFTMFMVFGIQNGILVSIVIAISYLAHMAVFYEQLKTGWLTFERIGSLEGVLLSAILIALSSFSNFHQWMTNRFIADYTPAEIFILLSAGGALLTFAQTWRRTPEVGIGYWIFTSLLLLLGIGLPLVLTPFHTFAVLSLYASLYIGRLMYAHLIDGAERHTDIIVPLVLGVSFLIRSDVSDYLAGVLFGYLIIQIFILIFKTFSTLKSYWVWQNVRT